MRSNTLISLLVVILILNISVCLAGPSAHQERIISALETKKNGVMTELVNAQMSNDALLAELLTTKYKVTGVLSELGVAQVEAKTLVTENTSLKNENTNLKVDLKAEVSKRLQTGRERDLFILLFAILSTLYFYPIFVKFLNQFAVFIQFTWLAYIVSPAAIFVVSFLGIRLIVQFIVKLIF